MTKNIRLSVSQVNTFRQCPRLWAKRAIDYVQSESTFAQAYGLEGHKRIEDWYLKSKSFGSDDLGQLIRKAVDKNYLPIPNIKHEIENRFSNCTIAAFPGVEFSGIIDLAEPWTKTVIDHKFTSSYKYVQKPEQNKLDLQNLLYSYVFMLDNQIDWCYTKWIYYISTGKTRPRKVLGVRPVINTQEYDFVYNALIANLEPDIDTICEHKRKYNNSMEIEPKLSGCSQYGGCIYREQCNLTGQQHFIASIAGTKGGSDMGLMDELRKNMKKEEVKEPKKEEVKEPKKEEVKEPKKEVVKEEVKEEAQKEEVKEEAQKEETEPKVKEEAQKEEKPKRKPRKKVPSLNEIQEIEEEVSSHIKEIDEHYKTITDEDIQNFKLKVGDKYPLIVYINCVPVKGVQHMHLIEVITPLLETIQKAANVLHWSMMDFGKSKGALAAGLLDNIPTGHIVVNSQTQEGIACMETLIAHADVVVRGV